MAHFYLTLPSNSSERYYPDNKVTRYTTRLQKTIDLEGDWEAALVKMMFTKTWYTIPKHSGQFYFSCFNCEDFVPRAMTTTYSPNDYTVHMTVPFGHYTKMQEIVDAIISKLR